MTLINILNGVTETDMDCIIISKNNIDFQPVFSNFPDVERLFSTAGGEHYHNDVPLNYLEVV